MRLFYIGYDQKKYEQSMFGIRLTTKEERLRRRTDQAFRDATRRMSKYCR